MLSLPNCGLWRLPGNERTSTRRRISVPSSSVLKASAGRVPCPTVYRVVTPELSPPLSARCPTAVCGGRHTPRQVPASRQPIHGLDIEGVLMGNVIALLLAAAGGY